MVTLSTSFPTDSGSVQRTGSGPFHNACEYSPSKVLLSDTRRRCIEEALQNFGLLYSFHLAGILPLVLHRMRRLWLEVILIAPSGYRSSQSSFTCQSGTTGLYSQKLSAFTGLFSPPSTSVVSIDSQEIERCMLCGYSNRVLDTLLASRLQTTRCIYSSSWRIFLRWCRCNTVRIDMPRIRHVLIFFKMAWTRA